MKEKIINSLVVIIIIVVMAALLIPWPKEFIKDFSSIKYQLGPDNQMYSETIHVYFNGTYKKSYFGLIEDRFIGSIVIDDVDIYQDEEFNLSFSNEKGTVISHTYFVKAERAMRTQSYGKLYVGDKFETITIELYTGEAGNEGFNSFDGYMISAPAENRAEALTITKMLVPYAEIIQ